MNGKTRLPATALIALIAAGPLAWAQEAHTANAEPSASKETKAGPEASTDHTVAMAAGQPYPVCNDRSSTVACSAKTVPHEPQAGVPPVNPADQAPSPKQ
jgi:hypothetical protein